MNAASRSGCGDIGRDSPSGGIWQMDVRATDENEDGTLVVLVPHRPMRVISERKASVW
jgi:hypothetical protein